MKKLLAGILSSISLRQNVIKYKIRQFRKCKKNLKVEK